MFNEKNIFETLANYELLKHTKVFETNQRTSSGDVMYFVQVEEFRKYCRFSQVIRFSFTYNINMCLSLSSTFVRYNLFWVNVKYYLVVIELCR